MNFLSNRVTRLSFTILAVLFLFSASSCSTKLKFATSNVVPAAQGSVKIGRDDNGNYELDLNILHLTEPSRLSPSKELYVVWMETKNNGTKNIGQLKSASGFFSSTLKASFHTVTSFEPKGFFLPQKTMPTSKVPDLKWF
ncbi:hypothetical protein [Mucilaginibacter arboris]|uniref:hypothetical protein n=1 Tax=Mucilaginibacter arboris TaxID=2682090 RepID=UPI0018DC7DF4|nr:hypothetical protein [Mucilaginibacter arboris]